MNKKVGGFTIVELLIVIVVIAILAAITIVAYNGIQNRASDSVMRQSIDKIEKALLAYTIDHGVMNTGNDQATIVHTPGQIRCEDGNGVGWMNVLFTAGDTYRCNSEQLLVAGGYLPQGYMQKLPANKNTTQGESWNRRSVMLYRCDARSQYILFYSLQAPTVADEATYTTFISSLAQAPSCAPSMTPTQADYVKSAYGMRAVRVVKY